MIVPSLKARRGANSSCRYHFIVEVETTTTNSIIEERYKLYRTLRFIPATQPADQRHPSAHNEVSEVDLPSKINPYTQKATRHLTYEEQKCPAISNACWLDPGSSGLTSFAGASESPGFVIEDL